MPARRNNGLTVKPPHTQGTGQNRLDCQTANTGERSSYVHREQRFAVMVQSAFCALPISSEPFHKFAKILIAVVQRVKRRCTVRKRHGPACIAIFA
jgi:hypothetical protein